MPEHVRDDVDELARQFRAAHYVVLAGRAYRDEVAPGIERTGGTWEAPMAGLGIGRQLAWLNAHTPA